MNNKGFSAVVILLIVVAILIVGVDIYYFVNKSTPASSPTPATLSNPTQTISKAIEKIDFLKFLASKYESANPTKGGDFCPVGSTELQNFSNGQQSIYYGDINGDGAEEAVVNYTTCQNGTGGGNSEVFALDGAGNPVT